MSTVGWPEASSLFECPNEWANARLTKWAIEWMNEGEGLILSSSSIGLGLGSCQVSSVAGTEIQNRATRVTTDQQTNWLSDRNEWKTGRAKSVRKEKWYSIQTNWNGIDKWWRECCRHPRYDCSSIVRKTKGSMHSLNIHWTARLLIAIEIRLCT